MRLIRATPTALANVTEEKRILARALVCRTGGLLVVCVQDRRTVRVGMNGRRASRVVNTVVVLFFTLDVHLYGESCV